MKWNSGDFCYTMDQEHRRRATTRPVNGYEEGAAKMYTNILTVLCCPHCGARFQLTESKKEGEEIMEGKIVCKEGHVFYVHDGILDFQSQEQEIFNSWNKFDGEWFANVVLIAE